MMETRDSFGEVVNFADIAPLVPKQGPKHKRFFRTPSTDLMTTAFPPIKWIVPGYLPEGLSVLAGRQKLGKTWLAIDWAIAVAMGGIAMASIGVEQGDVLYVDLENGPRRIQRRINTVLPDIGAQKKLGRLQWVTEAPLLNEGFIPALDQWRQDVPWPRLVVIDVLQRIKPAGSMARNSYENDYSIMADLQQWATKHGIAVMALHHTRKGGADDPLEALSGSNGLSACADTTLVLDRSSNGITLYVRGRDVEEKETALRFTGGFWEVIGEAHSVQMSDERREILEVLERAEEPMSPTEVGDALGKSARNIKKMLFTMAKAGEVIKEGRGSYRHPDPTGNLGNLGNLQSKPLNVLDD